MELNFVTNFIFYKFGILLWFQIFGTIRNNLISAINCASHYTTKASCLTINYIIINISIENDKCVLYSNKCNPNPKFTIRKLSETFYRQQLINCYRSLKRCEKCKKFEDVTFCEWKLKGKRKLQELFKIKIAYIFLSE